MFILKKLNWKNPKIIEKMIQSLQSNNVSITSTDTIYGLLSQTTKDAYYNMKRIKTERGEKPFLLLISNPEKLNLFVNKLNLTPNINKLIKQCWPGPLTLIFKAKKELPAYFTSNSKETFNVNETIAIRCPKHTGLLKLLKSFDALFSTSANKSGKKPPITEEEIDPTVIENIDYLVTEEKTSKETFIDRNISLHQNLPSTIIDVSDFENDIVRVVRKGKYKIDELEEYYGAKFSK